MAGFDPAIRDHCSTALGLDLDVQPTNTRIDAALDIEPLPILDIDSIADANLNRHIDLRTARLSR